MSDTRTYRLVRAVINGLPFMGELEGYTPPEVKRVMEDVKGGRFVASEIAVGLEKLTGEIKLSGATADLLASQGIEVDQFSQITILGSSEDAEKNTAPLKWEHTCEITSIKSGEVKPGKFDHTIAFSCRAYKHTDDGKVIYDINAKTQQCIIGGKDLLEAHRTNLEI